MDINDIKKILKKGESSTIEFNSSFGKWKEVIISLVAFANKHGGKVIIGIADDGTPLGMEIGKNTIEDIINKIKNNTDPVLYPSVNTLTYGPGEIVEIDIPESDNKPVFAFNKPYIRVGKSNQKISTAEVKKLIKKYTFTDFDRELFSGNIVGFDEKLTQLVLKKKIIKNKLTNAQYLCFFK
jgi:ATP-dependent DNA helicase RecG